MVHLYDLRGGAIQSRKTSGSISFGASNAWDEGDGIEVADEAETHRVEA